MRFQNESRIAWSFVTFLFIGVHWWLLVSVCPSRWSVLPSGLTSFHFIGRQLISTKDLTDQWMRRKGMNREKARTGSSRVFPSHWSFEVKSKVEDDQWKRQVRPEGCSLWLTLEVDRRLREPPCGATPSRSFILMSQGCSFWPTLQKISNNRGPEHP